MHYFTVNCDTFSNILWQADVRCLLHDKTFLDKLISICHINIITKDCLIISTMIMQYIF